MPSATASAALHQATNPSQPTPTDFPKGWEPSPNPKETLRISIILAVSLPLACFIISFVFACVLLRRKRARWRSPDPEGKLRKMQAYDDDGASSFVSASTVEDVPDPRQRALGMQKFWNRASSRWKSNVRSSARRRRTQRVASSARLGGASTDAFDDSFPPSHTPTASSTADVVTAFSSSRSSSPPPPPTPSPPPAPSRSVTPLAGPHDLSAGRSDPPAYPRDTDNTYAGTSSRGHAAKSRRSPDICRAAIDTEAAPAFSGEVRHHPEADPRDDEGCRVPPQAHVATDDKAVLARLQAMASAPPSRRASSSEQRAVAPEWRDEELTDFGDDALRPPPPPSSPPPPPPLAFSGSLPPPPEKVARAFYDDPEPAPAHAPTEGMRALNGPSEPPLDSGLGADGLCLLPSAPPLGEEAPLFASAPPLIEDESEDESEDERGFEVDPSAPPSDGSGGSILGEGSRPRRPWSDSLPTYIP